MILEEADTKLLGAYYTDAQVADFLVWWAVRSGRESVLDPCFGGGVFLRSACKRLLALGGDPARLIFGVEIDPAVYAQIADKLVDEFGVLRRNLFLSDFFTLDPGKLPPIDVAVGNPPFIRYQRFSGEARKTALLRAAEQGLRLSELSSSWLPFLVHSVAQVRPGGRLAMVIPVEIAHAAYATPVLDYLAREFHSVTFLTFRKKLFPDLSEGTLLLLGEGRGTTRTGRFYLRDLPHAGQLAEFQKALQTARRFKVPPSVELDTELIASGKRRLIESLIPRRAQDLYRELCALSEVRLLGTIADVGIGYVTGANDFFHLDPKAAESWGIPKRFLRPAVRRGRSLAGLRFTKQDWRNAVAQGEAGYLLHIKAGDALPEGLQKYLDVGKRRGVANAYKCRSRTPWFSVPHVYRPDALLTYMSGVTPRLVANDAGVVAPNSLHVVRLHHGSAWNSDALAALWQTSLTRLSVEIAGHALGGGMLKLEPSEAERVLVPIAPERGSQVVALALELDETVRTKGDAAAQHIADARILVECLGLSTRDCATLREAAQGLQERRYERGVPS